jgi:hypothetical protein
VTSESLALCGQAVRELCHGHRCRDAVFVHHHITHTITESLFV